jgi:hypothetical protein
VAKFKYLKAIINQISIHEEIKDRQNSGNACNHSVQTLSSFRFHNLYSSSYIIITKWTVHVASKTPFGNTHKLLVGKAEEKQPHGRPCRKAETTQLLRSRGCRMWTGLIRLRTGTSVNTVTNFRIIRINAVTLITNLAARICSTKTVCYTELTQVQAKLKEPFIGRVWTRCIRNQQRYQKYSHRHLQWCIYCRDFVSWN